MINKVNETKMVKRSDVPCCFFIVQRFYWYSYNLAKLLRTWKMAWSYLIICNITIKVAYKYLIIFFHMEPESAVKMCSECESSYKSKSGYSVHMRKHRKELLHKCCEFVTGSSTQHHHSNGTGISHWLAFQLLKQHLLIRLWFYDNGQ